MGSVVIFFRRHGFCKRLFEACPGLEKAFKSGLTRGVNLCHLWHAKALATGGDPAVEMLFESGG